MTWKLWEEDGDEWELKDGHLEQDEDGTGIGFRPLKLNGRDVDATWITVWLPMHKVARMIETL